MSEVEFYIVANKELEYILRNDESDSVDFIDNESFITDDNIFFDISNINKDLYTIISFDKYGFNDLETEKDISFEFCLPSEFLDKHDIYLVQEEFHADGYSLIGDNVVMNIDKIYELINHTVKPSDFQAHLENHVRVLDYSDTDVKKAYLEIFNISCNDDKILDVMDASKCWNKIDSLYPTFTTETHKIIIEV